MRLPRFLIAATAGAAIAGGVTPALSSAAFARTIDGKISYIGKDLQGGKDTVVHIGNKTYRLSTRPKVLIAGRPADVSALKPRMECKITLSHAEARQFICKRRPIAEF